MIICHVRPMGGAPADIAIADGRIAAITPSTEGGPALLALPGLVEGHCHLDKTLWGRPWWRNAIGPDREDRIRNEQLMRGELGMDPFREGKALAEAHLRAGTTRIRSHVDIDPESRLRHVEALLRLREAMAGRVEIQLVAFPQDGIVRSPGAKEWVEEALRLGCDVVGGMDPSVVDRDPVRHLDAVFGLAERHAKPVDVHLHEPGELGAFAIELMVERTRALGLGGRVTVSHGFALGEIAPARAEALLERMAEAGVAICSSAPPAKAVPPLRRARALGVTLFSGNDNIRDMWAPYNAPNMLERAALMGLKHDMRQDAEVEIAFETVSTMAAKGCGFAGYGLEVGARADIILLDAETLAEAVVTRRPPLRVVSHGREVQLR